MSADRFETDLRELLRSEAASAPVVITVTDLRGRAGRRSRWSWQSLSPAFRLAFAGASVTAVAVALALGLSRSQPTPNFGASPSPTGPAASVDASDRPGVSASRIPSPTPFVLQPIGTMLIARVEGSGVTILNVGPSAGFGGLRSVGSVHLPPNTPRPRVERDDVQAIGPDGEVLLTLSSGGAGTLVRTNVIARLGETASLERAVPDGRGMFARDGTLVIVDSSAANPLVWVVDAVSPAGRAVPVPAGVTPSGLRPILTTDGSGILATRTSGPNGTSVDDIILGLDGSVQPLTPTTSIDLVNGSERRFGLNGERLGGGCDTSVATGGHCVLIVLPEGAVNPDGTNITPPGRECCTSQIWTPDGKSVVMLTAGEIWAWSDGGTHLIASLDREVAAASPTIAGFISQPIFAYVLIHSDIGTTAVAMDRTSQRTADGSLLSVVR